MSGKPMLVVDDEKNIRLALSRSLEPLGRPVQTAMNGEEALQKMQVQDFDLVFLDLKMPGMDGLEALRRIRRLHPGVPVIIITAHGSIEAAVDAMKLGAVDFLQKPFGPGEIRVLAEQALQREAEGGAVGADPRTLVAQARLCLGEHRVEEARRAAQRAIAADPTGPAAYNLLGVAFELAGETAEARKLYRAALDVDPTYKPSASNLARITSWDGRGEIDLGPGDDAVSDQGAGHAG